MPLTSFISIDFETMTAERSSACAIGMVKVLNGVITSKWYTLINPIPDDRTSNNSHVHGITPEMVAQAPSFKDLFPQIKNFIDGLPIVCHNAPFDVSVMDSCMRHYALKGIDTLHAICSYEATGLSLEDACKKYKIPIGNHHDALDDAIACAKIYLSWSGFEYVAPVQKALMPSKASLKARKYEHSTLEKLDDESVVDKSTPFYGAKVVITGTFDAFPNRNKIGKALQLLGADINTTISKRTNIVIVGEGAGPSKMEKVEDLQNDGYDIQIMDESDLEEYISDLY